MRGISLNTNSSLNTYEASRFPLAESVLVLQKQVHLYMKVISGHTSHQNTAQFILLFCSTCVY